MDRITRAGIALAALGLLGIPQARAVGDGDQAPAWYYPGWLAEAPHAPVFQVRDTVNKHGRYAVETKTITIKDLIKFHGHFCGGLVEGATALRVAFDHLFPDGVIDRTDLEIASSNSACGGDVAAYLTGARALVTRPPTESVDVLEHPAYEWPVPPCRDLGRRRDNDYKAVPEAR